MDIQVKNYIVLICISGILAILMGVYAYVQKNHFSGRKTFIWISLFSAIYCFGHALELASATLEQSMFWIIFQYAGMPFIPPCFFILAMQYTGKEKYVTRRNIALLFVIPVLTLIFLSTNQFHELFYRSPYLDQNNIIEFDIGPWYVVHGSYTSGMLQVTIVLLFIYGLKAKRIYWRQILPLIAANLLPSIASFLYLMGYSPYNLDPVPIVMIVTSSLLIWSIYSTNLLVITPIAREKIIDSMRDGVIVVDKIGRIIDFNNAAKKIIPFMENTLIGKQLAEVLPIPLPILDNKTLSPDGEMAWEVDGRSLHFKIRVSDVSIASSPKAGKIIMFVDITEQKALQNKLQELAITDGLTGIYNRSYFMEQCQSIHDYAKDRGNNYTLILFDIDHFKKINDTYGHHIGDKAIQHVVEICRQHLQDNQLFCRYGGEEFAICLPKADSLTAANIAEMIRSALQSTPLWHGADYIPITASFGVAQFQAENTSLEQLFHLADQALYQAKEQGRNTVYISP